MITAKVVLASYNPHTGKTLYTVECSYPRFIHSELLTHRMFSRNASSSRAVPVQKMIDRVRENPVFPVHWGKNQKGMQAYEELDAETQEKAQDVWEQSLRSALFHAQKMVDLGVHKQVANRILEPYAHIQTLITATEWENFFNLRNHPAAQPEIRQLARAIKQAMVTCPIQTLEEGRWHTPYIDLFSNFAHDYTQLEKIKISVARCARVSYFLSDTGGFSTLEKDLELYDRLFTEKHLSPFEHIATPIRQPVFVDNFNSFQSWRNNQTTDMSYQLENGID